MSRGSQRMIIACYWLIAMAALIGATTGSKLAIIPFVYGVICTFIIRWIDKKERG